MKEAVVGIRWGIPSCTYVFFPAAGVVFFCCFSSYFSFESFELSCLYLMNSMVLTSGEVTGLSQSRVSRQRRSGWLAQKQVVDDKLIPQ